MRAGHFHIATLAAAATLVLGGCGTEGDDAGGDDDDTTMMADASPDQPDASPDQPDASPDQPDAAPGTPDAGPMLDAAIPAPEDCTNSADDDLDGMADCDDTTDCGMSLWCMAPACPSGQARVLVKDENLPKFITNTTPATAMLTVTQPGVATMAAVQIRIAHTFDGDLDISLRSPGGQTIDLSSDNGGGGDNYQNTVFVDSATTAITSGTPPFTGAFKPEQPLANMVNQPANGTWQVIAADDSSTDNGAFSGAELLLCVCQDCEIASTCADTIDNDNDMMLDCADPDCAPWCGIESSCVDGMDNDGDLLLDCSDPGCAPLCGIESSCSDMMDNDMDGVTDCGDPGCAVSASCEMPETTCNDGLDGDADMLIDCADPDCAFACALPMCAAGEKLYQLTKTTGLPVAIPDVSSVDATLMSNKPGTVTRAAVKFTIMHTWIEDVDVSLLAPAMTVPIDLASDNGGSGDHYTGTILVDSAATLVSAGSPPFTGQFKPEQPLSGVNGRSVAGTWTLRMADDEGAITGSLTEWSIAVCATVP